MSETVLCPACNKVIAVKGIPKHTNGCPKWAGVIGIPPSEFNFDKHYKRKFYADGLVEGQDFVQCLLCPDFRAARLADHLKLVHHSTLGEYLLQFPNAFTVSSGSLAQRQATVQTKYGVDNVAHAPEIRELLVANNRSQTDEAKAKRKATNLGRFGHDNPFGGEKGKARAQEGMRSKHGVSNPQQVPEIREQTLATTEARHGAPFFFITPGFRERFRIVSIKRWGADHPMKSSEGAERCHSVIRRRYGVSSVFQLPDFQQRVYQSNLANHGGKHSQQCPEVLDKARATWLDKYGVDNPSKAEEIKAKIKEVWMGKYGVPFPPQSLWMNRTQVFPNRTEQLIQVLAPTCVVYAGDGSYWVRSPGESRARNPDFVVLTADQLKAYQGGAELNGLRTFRVAECLGDYWHGPKMTGKTREVHAAEIIEFYKKAGIQCLLIWEGELKKYPMWVSERIQKFLGMSPPVVVAPIDKNI